MRFHIKSGKNTPKNMKMLLQIYWIFFKTKNLPFYTDEKIFRRDTVVFFRNRPLGVFFRKQNGLFTTTSESQHPMYEPLFAPVKSFVLDNDFVLRCGQRFFSQSIKDYETQNAYRKTKNCFAYQQSFGLYGASCYLCQYSLSPNHRQKSNWKKVEIFKKDFSENKPFLNNTTPVC